MREELDIIYKDVNKLNSVMINSISCFNCKFYLLCNNN